MDSRKGHVVNISSLADWHERLLSLGISRRQKIILISPSLCNHHVGDWGAQDGKIQASPSPQSPVISNPVE